MTRTVFDNDMVAHVWAQQNQSEGRSHNGNFSFEGEILYSYRTPIARFISIPGEGVATLVTSETYSVTTSGKHMTALWRAIGYNRHAFTVPTLGDAWRTGQGKALDHAANLAHLQQVYSARIENAKRVRDLYRDRHDMASELEALAETANRYARLFGLIEREFDADGDAVAIMTHRAERDAKRNTPAAIAKREAAKLARERKAARALELERANGAERIAAWRTGERVFLSHGERIDAGGGALLRVRGDMLETSLGASVPLAHAVRVFRFVKLCRENAQEWRRNGRTLRVGHFQVDSVDTAGNFRAGCHLINWHEVEQAATAAGVIDEAAADTRDVPHAA